MRFARLFERDGQQVLVMTAYDDEEDVTRLRAITETESGVRMEVSSLYRGEDQTEKAAKALETLTEDVAFGFFSGLNNLVK